MDYNIIYKDGTAFKILTEVNLHMFKNSDESINQQALGKYVHEWAADKVLRVDNKFLICRTIEDAVLVDNDSNGED
jgi:hypothetical protein